MRLFLSGFVLALGLASVAAAQETQTYTYDVHGRLVQVVRTVGMTARTTAYTLDNADNRSQRATTVTTSSGLTAQPEAEGQAERDPASLPASSVDVSATEQSETDEATSAAVPPATVRGL